MNGSGNTPAPKEPARAYVLGGNAGTLAFVSSLRANNKQVTAWLVPLAWTPIGAVVGDGWQRVNVAADNLPGWVDQTFPHEDERAFVTPLRDVEMLQRSGWHADAPEKLTEQAILNPEDVPEDVLDAISHDPEPLTQCAVCRRTCVRDHFAWNERQLCAWDYHATVFGKRGPWRNEPYEERLFETLPNVPYIAPALLDDAHVEPVLAAASLPEDLMRTLINQTIAAEKGDYLAVRTDDGLTLLRERRGPRPPAAE
ncbi:MAG: hypothetical protein GIW95_01060 [Candidatus Eremiobacteraeota bacterium]|nr:hypothetical protein [Candidatus Eremiobacteraeota bacterium]